MNVAIIEDEPLAAEKLKRYLGKYDSSITVLTVLNSLETAISWIKDNNGNVDLYFMDVQLIDGLSFQIFSSVSINKPVIFTTAFDEYAIDAFKVNSIDYLLKPITFTDLSRSLEKLKTLEQQFSNAKAITPIINELSKKTFKDRFLIRIGNHLRSILTNDISAFYAEGRDVCLVTLEGKEYPVEYTIDTLKELLDPKDFFRVNRSYLVSLPAIVDVVVYSNRRLKLSLKNSFNREIIVSRERVADFKQWFEGN
ncbi:LytR/AlgR family response regulator transcription factor [Croceivirga thetidis]|uniref:Response regulator transcription factor n=1 Tax=Croceivirga thetidis TaxID=2721623 RepID=A0ABX1GQV7_9FLAO|nr:LytTR family DNA-binding domain-containing protein [Croceivirga thetidis]NKI32327.1 response regulator transcription factor [Croceivirga thetidis]